MRFNRRQLAITAAALPLVNSISAFSQSATPASPVSGDVELAAASMRITSLGQYMPGEQRGALFNFNWIDLQRQLFHIARDLDEEGQLNAGAMTSFGTGIDLMGVLVAIETEIGFNHLNIRQAISSPLAENNIQLIQLDINVAGLTSTWEQTGYQERENEFGSYWTLSENDEIDYDIPIQSVVFGSLNNIVVLDDHSIAFAPTSDSLRSVMATASGEGSSVLNGLDSTTASLPEDAISAIFAAGSIYEYQRKDWYTERMVLRIDDLMALSNDSAGPMPTIRTVVAGTTQGAMRDEAMGDPNAVTYIILETDSGAEQAASVVTWRHDNLISLASGQSYMDMLGEIETIVVSDDLLLITSSTGAQKAVFSRMLNEDDDLLFMFEPDN